MTMMNKNKLNADASVAAITASDIPAISVTGPTDINFQARYAELAVNTIYEELPKGIVLGTLSAVDADTGSTFTYQLVSGSGDTDNARFVIDGNQLKLSATGVLDYETDPVSQIRIRVTDNTGASYDKALNINLVDVQEPRTVLYTGMGGDEGFGENVLVRTDDSNSVQVTQDQLTSVFKNGLNFFGKTYDSLFINNNGNITFTRELPTFDPSVIPGVTDNPIIAVYFDDVDTRAGVLNPSPGGTSTGSNLVYWDLDPTSKSLTVTWDDVGKYSVHTIPNAFQLRLTDLGSGDFKIEYRYESIDWIKGDINANNARAGYSAGDGIHFYELPQSGTAAMLDLETATNTGQPGVYTFVVNNGTPLTPPSVVTPLIDAATFEDNVFSYTFDANTFAPAAVGEMLTYTATLADGAALPSWLHFNGVTRTFSGTPDDADIGVIAVRVIATDPHDLNAFDDFNLTITSINDAPSGTDSTLTLLEDHSRTLLASDFGFNDSHDLPANSLLAVKITSLPTAGSLKLNGVAVTAGQVVSAGDIAAGKLVFSPAANANGNNVAHFTFQVQDNGGTANGGIDLDASANTLTFNLTAVNDAPAGIDNTVSTLGSSAYTLKAGDFRFSDPNDSVANILLAVKITSLPATGSLKLNGVAVVAGQLVSVADINANKLVFTPPATAAGASYAHLTFQVQDNGGTANGGVDLDATANTLTFSVTALNHAPSGTDKTVTMLEDTAYSIKTSDFGFTDPNDSAANILKAVKITSLPAAGSLKLNGVAVTAGQFVNAADIAANKLVFAPAAHANGNNASHFTFQVQDNGGTANGGIDLDSSANTLAFNVTAINDAPAGTDKTATLAEDSAYILKTGDFGFTDPNDSPANALLAVKITSLPSVGLLKLNGIAVTAGQSVTATDIAANKLVFAPAANANGANYASVAFQVRDNGGTANGGVDLDPTTNKLTFNVTAVRDDLNLVGTAGDDVINGDLIDTGSFDTLSGLAGNDTLNGLAGDDVLFGGAGDDRLNGGVGADKMTGGDGNDSYFVDNVGDVVTETSSLATEVDTVNSSISYTLGANLENLTLTAANASNGTGNALNNVLVGNNADNVLTGGAGNDSLTGGSGADTFIGGLGKDSLVLTETNAATDRVVIAAGDSLVTGADVVTGFKLGVGTASASGVDQLDLPGTVIAANAAAVDGIDVGIIKSHHIVNGVISFDDADNFITALAINANGIPFAIGYLQHNITTLGTTVAFNAGSDAFVFQDGGVNDTLVRLVGVHVSSLSTTGLGVDAVWLV